jgi:hypothetical protein
MPKRDPLPLWIVVSIFLASVTAVPLTCRLLTRPATPPPAFTKLRTLTELAEVLSQDAPELRVVPSAKDGSLETGMYLCNDSRSWEQLISVLRSYRHADKWQGLVYCERDRANISTPESEIQMWGEHTMRIGPFLFFGDPHLLRRIDQIIRNHSKG